MEVGCIMSVSWKEAMHTSLGWNFEQYIGKVIYYINTIFVYMHNIIIYALPSAEYSRKCNITKTIVLRSFPPYCVAFWFISSRSWILALIPIVEENGHHYNIYVLVLSIYVSKS